MESEGGGGVVHSILRTACGLTVAKLFGLTIIFQIIRGNLRVCVLCFVCCPPQDAPVDPGDDKNGQGLTTTRQHFQWHGGWPPLPADASPVVGVQASLPGGGVQNEKTKKKRLARYK